MLPLTNPLTRSRLGRRLGWPGLVGLGLWALCLALFFTLVQPVRLSLEDMRLRADSLQGRVHRANQALQSKDQSPEAQLAEFYRIFPSEQAATDVIGRIETIAQRHGLNLDQGEYKVAPDKQGKLTRLRMMLPLRGSYAQIRAFLAELGRELPIVAPEQLQFERQQVGDALLDAKLQLVLFLGQAS